ncbi:DUF1294 domain-containing protein [Neobacillus massiliamazoniensis]|uniref:Putative membrane component n=1 Tax=Neobacillus massiliamazoniensis TaxID=1499688 RepID=A0A0U1P272_9BACI|nr:DUF1294 domain-containing protein [Neobacillus massiliamazoniensis]CRK84366.1 putative membrane component [Neobacillus massiliamazoniensis]
MAGRTYVFAVLLIMNIIGLMIMGIDKNRAIKHKYRIRERTLWLVAIFGGAIGTTIGMQVYRHKTKHLSFKIGFPLLAILEIVLSCAILSR